MLETSQIRWLMYCKSATCKSGQFEFDSVINWKLDVARNHFCDRVVSLWNGLPEHVVTAASLKLVKKYLPTIDFSSYNFIKFDRNL